MYFTVFIIFGICILSKCILSIIIRLSEDIFGSWIKHMFRSLSYLGKHNIHSDEGIIRIHTMQMPNEMYINRKSYDIK